MASGRPTVSDAAAAMPPVVPRGTAVGRYLIVDTLGGGGMGVVYAAYDPQLDRKVAIKLVHTDATEPSGRARLLREAQSMARLAHPNVRAVYDVGDFGEQVFIAMELVEGRTLDEWLAERPRTWREIVALFREAGRGLAAAHAAELVHRDFKPQNVLVGRDGRVRVSDFGLARAALDEPLAAAPKTLLATSLTQTGAVLGTPLYMAPEQHQGRTVDERADQFGFCVALYEALYGERPFDGATAEAIAVAAQAGRLRPAPADSRVPRWLREVVVRGLVAEPARRHPSMSHLIAQLGRDPSIVRRRVALGAVLVVALAAAGVASAFAWHKSALVCRGAEARLSGIWDAQRQKDIHAAFVRTGVPYAEDVFRGIAVSLDDYTRRWAAMRTETCEATRVRGEQSAEAMDLRMQCLDGRLQELRAQVDVLAGADAEVVQKAVRAAAGLSPLDECADTAALRLRVRPPQDGAQVAALRAEIARARALERVGRYAAGLAVAAPLPARARALAYRPIEAEALLVTGTLEAQTGDVKAAERTLEDAALAAEAARDEAEAARAWTARVGVAQRKAAHEAAHAWGRHAFAALEAAGGGPAETRARLLDLLGTVLADQGRYDEAVDHQRRALALREQALGKAHPDVAASLVNLGNTLDVTGKYDEALKSYQRALGIEERTEGREHPIVAATLTNMGIVLEELGRLGEAETAHRRALHIEEATLGRDHAIVASSLVNLSAVLSGEQRSEEALAALRRAIAIEERALGPDHPDLGTAWNNVGTVYQALGRYDEAQAALRRALAIREKALGPDHPDVGVVLQNLGDLAEQQGRHEEALADCRRALAVFDRKLDANHPYRAVTLSTIGRIELERGHAAAAVDPLERALSIRVASHASEAEIAQSRSLLAKARNQVRP